MSSHPKCPSLASCTASFICHNNFNVKRTASLTRKPRKSIWITCATGSNGEGTSGGEALAIDQEHIGNAYSSEEHEECLETSESEAEASAAVPEPAYMHPSVNNPESSFVLDPNGWILAFSVLLAARLGRITAQESRLDVKLLQQERERNRAFSSDLRKKRERWISKEAERKALDDAKRVAEAAEKAREAARIEREKQLRYQQEAAAETERLWQEKEAQKKVYEKEQARLDEEYKARLEQEMKVIEEQREKARQEEERRRKEEEERKRKLEEERRAREEKEKKEREEAIRRKIEERKQLEKEKKMFAVRMEGTIKAQRPPAGTLLPGPLEKEAKIQVTATASTMLGGASGETSELYSSPADAAEALGKLVGQQVKATAEACASAMRLQAMTGTGPLAVMEESELQHWMDLCAGRAAVQGLLAGEAALANLQKSNSATPEKFEVRTEYGVLPEGHAKRTDAAVNRAIARIEEGAAYSDIHAALEEIMDTDNAIFYKDLTSFPEGFKSAPQFLGSAFALAYVLNVMLHDRPAKVSDAPAWFEAAVAHVRQELKDLVVGAPQDSLRLPSIVISSVLGNNHPVSLEISALADANESALTRTMRQEKQRIYQTELAEKLLEEEWPDEEELRVARLADKQAKTPIPERVWALRNVAGTLAMGGPGERSRARQLLEQAVLLKQQFAGAPDHPAVLPELVALGNLLSSEPDWANDAAGVSSLILKVLGNIAAAYQKAKDPISAAIVLEAGLRQQEEIAGVRSSAVKRATKQADAILEDMQNEDDRKIVIAHRPKTEEVLAKVSSAMTEELAAYKQGSESSKVDDWNELGTKMIGAIRLLI